MPFDELSMSGPVVRKTANGKRLRFIFVAFPLRICLWQRVLKQAAWLHLSKAAARNRRLN